jgi:hypothetical protein
VEFQRPEDASSAANFNEHIIHGKKASIQFFKTKEAIKKPSCFEKTKRSEQGITGSSTSLIQKSAMYSKHGTFHESAADYQQVNHFCLPKADVTETQLKPLSRRFAAAEPIKHHQRQHSSEFYASLGSASYKRYLAGTYSEENLRFNRPVVRLY